MNFWGLEHWILKGCLCVPCSAERRRAAKGAALCTLFLSKVIAELRALLTILIQSSILLVFPPKNWRRSGLGTEFPNHVSYQKGESLRIELMMVSFWAVYQDLCKTFSAWKPQLLPQWGKSLTYRDQLFYQWIVSSFLTILLSTLLASKDYSFLKIIIIHENYPQHFQWTAGQMTLVCFMRTTLDSSAEMLSRMICQFIDNLTVTYFIKYALRVALCLREFSDIHADHSSTLVSLAVWTKQYSKGIKWMPW